MNNKYFKGASPGIPDNLFLRGEVPMTKEEIRIITLAKARLEKDMTIYDIGAGTGSLSIEAARMVPQGKVYAVEEKNKAIELIHKNIVKFNLDNIEVVEGKAPKALKGLPCADRVIIGGSGGNLEEILKWTADSLKPEGIVVLNAVTLNTLYQAYELMREPPFCDFQALQVGISTIDMVGKSSMFKSRNPIFILRARKES